VNGETYDETRLFAARKRIVEALAEYADAWDSIEGGLVVSFVCACEVMAPDGSLRLFETCGSGSEGESSLAVWRREGILHNLLAGDRVEAP
jgi:hypothetical protein